MGFVDSGVGACALTTGGNAAARCACAGTEVFTALPLAVALAGASIVTLVTFLTLVTLVTFLMLVVLFVVLLVVLLIFVLLPLLVTRMPTATTGGALVITAGAVPRG